MGKVVVVDKNDEQIGAVDKTEAIEKGMIRRISRVFMFNDKGEVFLQRRSENKDTFPGAWDESAGGHVDEGESYEEAARRELREELGVRPGGLEKVAKFYIEEMDRGRILRQFSVGFEAKYSGEIINLQKDEISDGKWFLPSLVDKMMSDNEEDFPPGFVRAWAEYKRIKQLV